MKEPIQINVDDMEQDPSVLDAVVSIEVTPVTSTVETGSAEMSTKMESFDNDYESLVHKPKIEGVTLVGDKSLEDLNVNLANLGASIATNMQIDDLFK